ncbi:redox-sensing transcriptional repressor [Bacilli bacterium PM5-3]|nr:redox-sensing transcriptional repressor [Bacilli bacterium PM5-3]MDH6603271.1 redox-sensing transcriptional repressor [Bacilli bacterium PM5-9]
MSKYVPYATRKRLPIYYKILKSLQKKGVDAITSTELSNLLKIDSTTIRRDFSAIGKLGKKGTGYPISSIIEIFENEFDLTNMEGVILIGLGHLGSAVAKYYDIQDSVSYLSQIYEVDDELIGTTFMGVDVLDYKKINQSIDKSSHIAVLTVSEDKAQAILDELVELGIKGFINFTGAKVFCEDPNVLINDIDIMQVVQSLIYDLRTGY